jgi:hypothetical protein
MRMWARVGLPLRTCACPAVQPIGGRLVPDADTVWSVGHPGRLMWTVRAGEHGLVSVIGSGPVSDDVRAGLIEASGVDASPESRWSSRLGASRGGY